MGWPNEATHWGSAFVLTEKEKIRLGIIKKPKPLAGLIQIVIPERYGFMGVMWASRFVTEAELEGYIHQFPNMQILDEKYKVRREETEDAEPIH